MTSTASDQQSLKDEIADLERRLRDAKAQLTHSDVAPVPPTPYNDTGP
jgi:urease accessory protein